MNTKKILIILGIIICVIILILFGIINYLTKKNNEKLNTIDVNRPYIRADYFDDDIESVDDEVIIPNNSYLFFGEYINGEVDGKEIYEVINNFAKKRIPELYKELNGIKEADVSTYFSTNKNILREYLDINYESEFVDFLNKIKNLKSSEISVSDIEFVEGTIKYDNKYTTSKLKITYSNNVSFEINIKVYRKVQENNRNIVFY